MALECRREGALSRPLAIHLHFAFTAAPVEGVHYCVRNGRRCRARLSMHSIHGDLVDLLTKNGGFAFLEEPFETSHLWDLRNFRIPRLIPRGTASKDIGDSL